jgi:hypothetical protein
MRYLASIALLGWATLFGAQPQDTIFTLTISGALGAIVNSGSDCLGLNGQSVSVVATLQVQQVPFQRTKDTVTYQAPISGSVGPLPVSGGWAVAYTITSSHNAITFRGQGPMGSVIELTAFIPPNTISRSVFQHPQPLPARFSPEPLSYPGSSLSYTATACGATQLALTGQLIGTQER